MNDSDGRKINRKALEAIGIRAVRLVEAGESPDIVIKALGFARTLIYELLAKYREAVLMPFDVGRHLIKGPIITGCKSRRYTPCCRG